MNMGYKPCNGFQSIPPTLLCSLQTILYIGEEGWFEGRKYEEGEINYLKKHLSK